MTQSSFLYFNSNLLYLRIPSRRLKFQDYIQPLSSGVATLPLLAGFRLCLKIEKASHIFGVYLRLPVSFLSLTQNQIRIPEHVFGLFLNSKDIKIFL